MRIRNQLVSNPGSKDFLFIKILNITAIAPLIEMRKQKEKIDCIAERCANFRENAI